MAQFTTATTMGEVFTAPVFAKYAQYLMYTNPEAAGDGAPSDFTQMPLAGIINIGWSPEGVTGGLNFFAETIEAGRAEQYFVYDEAEITDKQQKNVNLIRLIPEEWDQAKPTVVLAAGGAYGAVCTMVEALPTARHFVNAGYQTFLFTYRVGVSGAALLALDDLARGIRYLKDHSEEFRLDPNRLVIGGYSAGANLISNWGAPSVGYKAYKMPKPLALMPVYTFIDLKTESKRDENGGLLAPMFGPDYINYVEKFNIAEHIDGDYPPSYLVCGKDDNTVPPVNSEIFAAELEKYGVPAVLNEGNHAPHGFGDGTGTDVEGWPEKAMEFIASLEK